MKILSTQIQDMQNQCRSGFSRGMESYKMQPECIDKVAIDRSYFPYGTGRSAIKDANTEFQEFEKINTFDLDHINSRNETAHQRSKQSFFFGNQMPACIDFNEYIDPIQTLGNPQEDSGRSDLYLNTSHESAMPIYDSRNFIIWPIESTNKDHLSWPSKQTDCVSPIQVVESTSWPLWPANVTRTLENEGEKYYFEKKVQYRRISMHGRKHVCTVCDKRFVRPSSLQTHMFSHTGEKPFQCNFFGCNRKFSVCSNMKRHLKTHRSPENSIQTFQQF